MRSPWGRVLKGIREDEDAVRSLGKNVYSYKMQALVLGGVIGALGGHHLRAAVSVQPDALGRSTDVLHLDGPAARWRRDRLRSGARRDPVLRRSACSMQRPAPASSSRRTS